MQQRHWESVSGKNPSRYPQEATRPVTDIDWDDVQSFLAKLNQSDIAKSGRFALPSEAQWEYACRAGSDTAYSFGYGEERLGEYAWYSENSGKITHPVGQKLANKWGLHDLYGNVWEWVNDWYSGYPSEPQQDPDGPDQGSARVYRGGGWTTYAGHCRSAYRYSSDPTFRRDDLGFRLARIGPLSSYPFTVPEEEEQPPESPLAGLQDRLKDGSLAPVMAWLPGGTFMMGENESPYDDEKPAHEVTVSAFSIGQYPVTFEEYDKFCEATSMEKPKDRGWGRDTRPAIYISWEDAAAYCEWLSEQTGEQ